MHACAHASCSACWLFFERHVASSPRDCGWMGACALRMMCAHTSRGMSGSVRGPRRISTTRAALSCGLPAHAQVESIGIDEESLAALGDVGERTSLRHAVQLLTPSMMLARTNGRDLIARCGRAGGACMHACAQLFHAPV